MRRMTTNDITARGHLFGIDRENYTAELLKCCVDDGSISLSHAEHIREDFDKEFVEVAEQYTSRASSSVSLKIAQQLYSSVLYISDVYLLSLNDDGQAINALKCIPVSEILNRGRELISSLHRKNAEIFSVVYKTRLSFPLAEYRFAVDKAFDMYYSGYSARFDARSCCTKIDYPLLGRQAYELTSEGAMFINEYYTCLMYENLICGYFDEKDIVRLLEGCGRLYGAPYTSLLFNICEILVNNLASCLLIGKTSMCISLTAEDVGILCGRYSCHSLAMLTETLKKLFDACPIAQDNPRLCAYIGRYLPKLARELLPRIKARTLDNFLITEQY